MANEQDKPKGSTQQELSEHVELESTIKRLHGYQTISDDQYSGVKVKRVPLKPHRLASTAGYRFVSTETVISLVPTPDELRSAPKAVRRVLTDKGVNPDDQISLSLSIGPYVKYFRWAVMPTEITDDKLGTTLTREGEVIAPTSFRNTGDDSYIKMMTQAGNWTADLLDKRINHQKK